MADIQRTIANYLGAKAGALVCGGRAWLGAVLYAYVGSLIGTWPQCASQASLRGFAGAGAGKQCACSARVPSARSWQPSSGSRRSTPSDVALFLLLVPLYWGPVALHPGAHHP